MDLRKDIYFYDTDALFPINGSLECLYVDRSSGIIYSWNGTSYAPSGAGSTPTGLNYQGLWDANANSPLITSSVGTIGDYYIVGTAGTANINGINDWGIGDWIVFSSTGVWQKIDNSDKEGYNTIEDEGNPLTQRSTINFVGPGVSAADSGGKTVVTIAAGGLTEFTEAETTAAPNATVPVNSLTPVTSTTNADFAIVPKGTGALIAAIPDNTTTGGNKRGIGAVDLQMSRTAANQVASGQYSVVAGSRSNANDYSIAIGLVNSVNSTISASIGSGNTHAAGALYSHSVGRDNIVSAAATNSFVAGFGNTISNDRTTSLGASNTASGSAAVALGQQTTASGANSIAGGFLTTASGNQSVAIGGAYTLASNTWAVAIGANVTASGLGSVALGSSNTRATGDYSFAAGYNNFASAQGSFALGIGSTASGFRSGAMGSDGHTFGIAARLVWSGQQQGVVGDTQSSKFILQKRTTTNTATTLTADSATAGTANQVILSNNSAYRFKGTIIGKQSGSTNVAAWDVDGIIVRGANAASTTLSLGNVTLVQNTPAWGTPTLAADTTNGGLQVQVIGATATNIQWTAVIETTEVIYA